MRGTDLEAWEAVDRRLEDQMRQRDRGFERVADRVGEEARTGEPARRLQFAGAERVHENEHAQFFALGPERVEFGVGQFLAGDAAGNPDAAEAEVLDRMLDLLRGEVGMLDGSGRKGDKAVGMTGAEL